MKYLHQTVGTITVFHLMVIFLTTSMEVVVYWTSGYFEKEHAKYSVLGNLPSMIMGSLLHVADEMVDYLREDRDNLHVITTMGGEQRESFNRREIVHMEDVQILFLKVLPTRKACPILGVGLLTFMAATRARTGRVPPPSLRMGTGLFLGPIIVLGPIVSIDFTKYSILFHHTFSISDLWTLGPATDTLISTVLEDFFMDTAARIALLFGSLSLVLLGVCLLPTMRNRRKED